MNNQLINKQLSKLTFGGDPEVFISDIEGNIHSSIPILKRDKENPIVLDKKNSVFCYADNSLNEFAFKPAKQKREFVSRYRVAFKNGQKFLGKNYRLCIKSAHFFKENQLEAAYGIDPQQVGCSPEFDHFKGEPNNLGPFENTMRSGSSHIHIGHPLLVKDFKFKHEALYLLEIYLGCASVLWDNDPTSVVRRQKYGKSGSFRPTHYGIELRCMSNYMLNSPKLVSLTYDIIKYTMFCIFKGIHKEIISAIPENDIRNAINNCDKNLAKQILLKAKFPKKLFNRVIEESKKKYDMNHFYQNWKINV